MPVVPGTAVNDIFVVNVSPLTVTRNGIVVTPAGAPTSFAIDGDIGSDSLTVNGLATTDAFVLNASSLTVAGFTIDFLNVESLTLNGLAGDDTFTVQSAPGFQVNIKGGNGTDMIFGGNQTNTWNITGAKAGNLNGASAIAIQTMESWTGGTDVDVFVLDAAAGAKVTGKIDGGLGADRLDYSACATAVTVNLQSKTATRKREQGPGGDGAQGTAA